MFGGYMGKLLSVDLTTRRIQDEALYDDLCLDYIGGLGFGAKILFDRQKAAVEALGPENLLGVITGPLTGTPAIFGSRYEVVGKSPLTGTWGQANAGGDFGPYLKFAGYDGIFFSGISDHPVYLFIHDGTVEINNASHLWGLDTRQTEKVLRETHGDRVRVLSIGPAGEKLSLLANIMSTEDRAAARAGLGAVMGSKKLKAIVVTGAQNVPVHNRDKADELRKKHLGELNGPKVDAYRTIGTVATLQFQTGAVQNWSGVGKEYFPDVTEIGPVKMKALIEKKYGCYHCPVACGGTMKSGITYSYGSGTAKPEYETVCAFGSMCLNSNLESIIMSNHLCNLYGMDSVSVGATIAFAIECFEKGLINEADTNGIELYWGNHQAIVAITEKMARREGFGAILADGSKVAAEKIGKGASNFAINIHGQEPACGGIPLVAPSFAATYLTSATPAHHMEGGAEWTELSGPLPESGLSPLEKYRYSGKGYTHAWMRKYSRMMDAAGLCNFGFLLMALPVHVIPEQFQAIVGIDYSLDNLLRVGERVACVCQAFNAREGLKPRDFTIPDRMIGKPPLTKGAQANITLDIANLTKEFYDAMDWDISTGKPNKDKLEELGLNNIAADLWR